MLSARRDWCVCGEAANGLEAIEKAKQLQPDVVLMDVSMPRMNGLDATRILRRELPESKIVIVSQNDPTIIRRQVIEIDAAGYVAKIDAARNLVPTVESVIGQRAKETGAAAPVAATVAPSQDWLAGGGGELGRLIREYDWSRTSLGPIERWPKNLKISVSLMLNSRHPMWIGWGREMTFFYNDAYISVLGLAKHPGSLGRRASEVWSEIWHICAPLADKVFEKGEGSFVDDVRLFMNRGEFLEENDFSFSYSPIHGDAGSVDGLFCVNTSTTAKILNARRLATLSELTAKALVQKTAEAACVSIANVLARSADDVPFAVLYLIDEPGGPARLKAVCGVPSGVEFLTPEAVDLGRESKAECAWPLGEVVRSGKSLVLAVKGVEGLPSGLAGQRITEAMVLPVTSHGEGGAAGILVAGVSPARKLDPEYRTFYELIAGQIATAIQNVRAAEEERKRLEALAEIDRAKTAFFSNVSHEFRTPLTLMLGPVEELLERGQADLSPDARNQLELVNRNGARLLRLVNNLLDFSRIEAGRMQASYVPTDLAAFTVDLASVFRSAMEKAALQFELDCPELGQPVLVDPTMWEKIVLNLISNAFKFTFEGKISVSLRQAGDEAELRVSDTGVGIPEDEIPRLFDRFHRVENTRSRTHEGSGIGLALVQELVKLHGGSVRAASTLGKGTTFVVRLPLGSEHLPAERIGGAGTQASSGPGAAPFVEEALRWLPEAEMGEVAEKTSASDEFLPLSGAPEPQRGAEGIRARVLVADDNSDMRNYLGRLLGERYDVQTVSDGKAALDAIRERAPDLILTDAMMPQLDGFGLLRELRGDPDTRTIPVILLSARAGEESRVEGMEHGADDYLIKPFSSRELLARVQGHLALSLARKQAELALREKERRLRLATEAAELGIWHWYPAEDRAAWENDRAYEIYGRTREDGVLSATEFIASVIHRDDLPEFKQAMSRTLGSGERFFVQSRIYRKDGSLAWVEFTGNLEQGADGSPSRMLGTVQDITQRKQTEEMLRQQRDRFDFVARASQVGFWFCDLPFDKLNWDERVKDHFWLPADADVTIDTFYEHMHPEDRERTRQAIDGCIAQRLPYDVEYRTVARDGRQKWIRAIGGASYDATGVARRFDGITLDVTARRRAEAALRRVTEEAVAATAKFQAVFEQTPVFAGIMAIDGTLTAANRLSLEACGYHPEQVLDRPFWETPWWRMSLETQAKVKAGAMQAAQGKPYREVLPYHWADGTERIVEFALHPIRDEQGRIIFLHPTGVDITDLKSAEERYRTLAETLETQVLARTKELNQRNREILKQSEQLRSLSYRLMQIQDEERRHIARELHDSAGQVLAALAMNVSSVAQRARASDSDLAKEAEEGERLVQALSQEIRTMSYLLHPPLLDENGLAGALLWYIRGLEERSGLSIALTIPEEFGRLTHEMELAIFRIVQECLTNVHRHSGSKVAAIRIARDETMVSVEVQDEGKGIAAERLIEIQSHGAGVGIRGMRERVLQLGGEMKMHSDERGTSVSVVLPIADSKSGRRAVSVEAADKFRRGTVA